MPNAELQADFLGRVGNFCQILDALERVPGAMFAIKNLESRYLYASEALRRAIHVDAMEDLIGRTDFDLFPRMIAASFRQNDLLVFRHGRPLLNEVHLTCFFSEAPRWTFSSKFPIHDATGEVIGLVIVNEACEAVMGRRAELLQLLPAIDHVSKHYGERITVQDLASVCGVSASHFMRMFRSRMNVTAYKFIEQVRMHHAIEALKSGTTCTSRIALDCGFYDQSAFVKRFKKFTGTTPLKYRRRLQAPFSTVHPVLPATPAS